MIMERERSVTSLVILLLVLATQSISAYFSNNLPIVVLDNQAHSSAQQPRLINIKEISPNEPYQRMQAAVNFEPRRTNINRPSPRTSSSNVIQNQQPAVVSLNNDKYYIPIPTATTVPLNNIPSYRPTKKLKRKPSQVYYTPTAPPPPSPSAPPRPPAPAVLLSQPLARNNVGVGRKVRRQDEHVEYSGNSNESGDGDSGQLEYDDGKYHDNGAAEAKKDDHAHAEHEKGGGGEHHKEEHSSHGEKGDKGYKAWHEHDEGKKGHHDVEDHKKKYGEEDGEEKKFAEEDGHYKEYHHDEEGEKGSKFEEKGEYKKGHSTHGKHVIHKKDEYEKNIDFFDEDHSEEHDEKSGEYHQEHESAHGGKSKKGHYDGGEHEDKYGKKKEHSKGEHYHEKEGWDKSKGEEGHHESGAKYGKKSGHEDGKKWSYKKD